MALICLQGHVWPPVDPMKASGKLNLHSRVEYFHNFNFSFTDRLKNLHINTYKQSLKFSIQIISYVTYYFYLCLESNLLDNNIFLFCII